MDNDGLNALRARIAQAERLASSTLDPGLQRELNSYAEDLKKLLPEENPVPAGYRWAPDPVY